MASQDQRQQDPLAALPSVAPPRASDVFGGSGTGSYITGFTDPLKKKSDTPGVSTWITPSGPLDPTSILPKNGPAAPGPARSPADLTPQPTPPSPVSPPIAGGAVPFNTPDFSSPLQGQLNAYASGLLKNPNPYGSDYVQNALKAIDANLAESRRTGMNSLNEQLASRGLGAPGASSVGAEQMGLLQSHLQTDRQNYAQNLASQVASGELAGRQGAVSTAEGALNQALAGKQLGVQYGTAQAQIALQNRAQQLQEKGMNLKDAYGQAALELQQQQQQAQQEYQDQYLSILSQLGLSGK